MEFMKRVRAKQEKAEMETREKEERKVVPDFVNEDASSNPKLAAEKITRKKVLDLKTKLGKEGMPGQLVPGGSLVKELVKRVLEHVLLAPAPTVRKVVAAAAVGVAAAAAAVGV